MGNASIGQQLKSSKRKVTSIKKNGPLQKRSKKSNNSTIQAPADTSSVSTQEKRGDALAEGFIAANKLSHAQYLWLKEKIRSNIKSDIEQKLHNVPPHPLAPDDKEINKIAQEINMRLGDRIENKRCQDDHKGFLPFGFKLHHFGGLWQLSLDRVDNDLCHFAWNIHTKSWTSNIKLAAFLINHQTNTTPSMIKAKIKKQKNMSDLDFKARQMSLLKRYLINPCQKVEVMNREGRVTNNNKQRKILMKSIKSAWKRDKKEPGFRNDFPTYTEFVDHILELYLQQRGCSAISGILMDDTNQNSKPGTRSWAVSVDARQPHLLHTKENIRLVCSYENTSNVDKMKNANVHYEDQSVLNSEALASYIGEELPLVSKDVLETNHPDPDILKIKNWALYRLKSHELKDLLELNMLSSTGRNKV